MNGEGDRSSAAGAASLTLLLLSVLVLAQGALAYRSNLLTISQMRAAGVPQGLPFIWHFGIWSDFLVISPISAYLVGRYFHLWRLGRWWSSLAIGLVCASFLSWVYTLSSTPEAHVRNHQLTAAGFVHTVYAAAVIAILL